MDAEVPVVLLQLQQLVILQGQLDAFQFPHRFLEFAQLQVEEQGVYHVLVVVLECHELFPPYKGVKILITKANRMHYFANLFLIKNSACFGQIYFPSSGVSTLYMQQQVFVMLTVR
jgi:hypothetical protein